MNQKLIEDLVVRNLCDQSSNGEISCWIGIGYTKCFSKNDNDYTWFWIDSFTQSNYTNFDEYSHSDSSDRSCISSSRCDYSNYNFSSIRGNINDSIFNTKEYSYSWHKNPCNFETSNYDSMESPYSKACTDQTAWFDALYFIDERDMFFIALVALFQYTMIWVVANFISFWLHFW